ncbi:MAG: hypothetical protein K2Q22_08370, partial [Cytophagales bacterium]|nr:hypothetical protein [Cytophagales bacterium]
HMGTAGTLNACKNAFHGNMGVKGKEMNRNPKLSSLIFCKLTAKKGIFRCFGHLHSEPAPNAENCLSFSAL